MARRHARDVYDDTAHRARRDGRAGRARGARVGGTDMLVDSMLRDDHGELRDAHGELRDAHGELERGFGGMRPPMFGGLWHRRPFDSLFDGFGESFGRAFEGAFEALPEGARENVYYESRSRVVGSDGRVREESVRRVPGDDDRYERTRVVRDGDEVLEDVREVTAGDGLADRAIEDAFGWGKGMDAFMRGFGDVGGLRRDAIGWGSDAVGEGRDARSRAGAVHVEELPDDHGDGESGRALVEPVVEEPEENEASNHEKSGGWGQLFRSHW